MNLPKGNLQTAAKGFFFFKLRCLPKGRFYNILYGGPVSIGGKLLKWRHKCLGACFIEQRSPAIKSSQCCWCWRSTGYFSTLPKLIPVTIPFQNESGLHASLRYPVHKDESDRKKNYNNKKLLLLCPRKCMCLALCFASNLFALQCESADLVSLFSLTVTFLVRKMRSCRSTDMWQRASGVIAGRGEDVRGQRLNST